MKGHNKEGSRARNWLLTLNQQEGRDLPDAEEWLNRLFTETKATYVIGQLERGAKSQAEHISKLMLIGLIRWASVDLNDLTIQSIFAK